QATLRVIDEAPPTVTVESPNGGEYWELEDEDPDTPPPSSQLISWSMSDDVRICKVEVGLDVYDGSAFEQTLELASFGGELPCSAPGETTNHLAYTMPADPPGGAGKVYRVRVQATDHAGNVSEPALSENHFFMVRPIYDDVKTLILSHLPRMKSRQNLSEQAIERLRSELINLEGHPKVQGVQVDLSLSESINNLYEAWDANRGNPEKVNQLLFEPGGIHHYLRTEILPVYSKVEHLIIVGDDSIIPMARILDRTGLSESSYTKGQDLDPTSTTVGQALSSGHYLTDDLLALTHPVSLPLPTRVFRQGSFIPELLVGRLVESPDEIIHTISTFISQNGLLDLSQIDASDGHPRATIAAYDFLTDSGRKVRRLWKRAYS
ncbi:hypothetical protein AC249_AIPGENE1559, partial [Exaiptasia diaphana]